MASELITLMEQKMTIEMMKTIDSMPNELVRTILAKVEVHKLIGIRVVSKRWKAIIEDICQEKASIVLLGYGTFRIHELSRRFNQKIDMNMNNYAILEVKSADQSVGGIALSSDLVTLLVKLFPRVQHLIFNTRLDSTDTATSNLFTLLNNWSASIVTLHFSPQYCGASYRIALSSQIDKLTALKRLSFEHAAYLNPSTLVQLEHCSLRNIAATVPHLGPGCTSLFMDSSQRISQMSEGLLKSVTHLGLTAEKDEFTFVCERFGELKMLDLRVRNKAKFNAYVITQLARLTNLSQLSIELFNIDLPIAQAQSSLPSSSINLPTLDKITNLTLSRFSLSSNGSQFDGNYEQLCRELANIFPNITKLTVELQSPLTLATGEAIARHIHHFAHLGTRFVIRYCTFMGAASSSRNSRW